MENKFKTNDFIIFDKDRDMNIFKITKTDPDDESVAKVDFVFNTLGKSIEEVFAREIKMMVDKDDTDSLSKGIVINLQHASVVNDSYINERIQRWDNIRSQVPTGEIAVGHLVTLEEDKNIYKVEEVEVLTYEKDYPQHKIKCGDCKDTRLSIRAVFSWRQKEFKKEQSNRQYSIISVNQLQDEYVTEGIKIWEGVQSYVKENANVTTESTDSEEQTNKATSKDEIISDIEQRISSLQEEQKFLDQLLDKIKRLDTVHEAI